MFDETDSLEDIMREFMAAVRKSIKIHGYDVSVHEQQQVIKIMSEIMKYLFKVDNNDALSMAYKELYM